ncbi:hypothetical protein [Xylanivirga thermophila]|uniref:hypothetical protein n=1 Tax=Xylanivirga thermophila TaxID=2496273 RepID=UPI00101C8ACB|nr:hypothetical protein [Xylanivirga thermophila]
MVNKKRVSKVLVFVLLIGTLLSSVAFAADTKDYVIDKDIKISTKAHIQSFGDREFETDDKGVLEFGTTGKAKRLEEFALKLEGAPKDMAIEYRVHGQSYGDMPAEADKWIRGDKEIGSRGKAKRIEGIQIRLVNTETGKAYEGYSVEYQVHMQSFGWGVNKTDKGDVWAKDGEFAGTKGLSKRLEAVRVRIKKEDELKVKSVSAITSKSLKVEFNRAIDTEGVTFSVKRGSAVVVLDVTFSEDKKSAILSSPTPLVAGEYTVVVNGGKFEEGSNSATVKVEAEKETSLTILTESVQKVADAKVAFEVRNQYGEVMNVVSSNVVATGYDKTAKDSTNTAGPVTFSPVAGKTQFQADLTGASIGVGDEILLTLSYKGLTATKTLKVEEASALSTLQLAAPSPLQGKQRITVGETIELPYTAKDQYGVDVKLPATAANADSVDNQERIGDYLFTSSNPSVVDVDSITIDSEGKASFVAAGSGTTKITAVNVKTGDVTSVDVQVSAPATEDSIVLTAPTKLVAAGEKVKVPFVVYDQFGGTISTANLNTSNITLASSNTSVATVAWNGKEIEITGVGAGTAEITATIGTKVAKFSIDIQEAARPAKITGVKDLATVLTEGSVSTIDPSKVVVKDQYGRDYKLKNNEGIAVYVKDGSETSVDVQHTVGDVAGTALASAGVVTADGTTSTVTLTGKATAGTETVVLQLVSNTGDVSNTAIAGGSFEVQVTTKAQADVTSYEIKEIPTLFAVGGTDYTSSYAKAIEVVAKDASGNVVALPASAVKSVTLLLRHSH